MAMPLPEDKQALLRFLNIVKYQGKFIPGESNITAPLRALLKEDAVSCWQPEHTAAVNQLKRILSSKPVLRFYDVNAKPDLQERQQRMKRDYYRGATSLKPLTSGDVVRVQRKWGWDPAIVQYTHESPRSYVVRHEGGELRRNRRHLRRTREQLPLFLPGLGDPCTGVAAQPSRRAVAQPLPAVVDQPSRRVVAQPPPAVVAQPSRRVVTQPPPGVVAQSESPPGVVALPPPGVVPQSSPGAAAKSRPSIRAD